MRVLILAAFLIAHARAAAEGRLRVITDRASGYRLRGEQF